MLEKDCETAKRGMRIWYEEEFAEIEADFKKELITKLAEKDMEIAEMENEIVKLNAIIKSNGITNLE